MADSNCIGRQIKQRRFRWPVIRHDLAMPSSDITKTAVICTPRGKRPRGWPNKTWRKAVQHKHRELNVTWGEAETKRCTEWRDLVLTLCSDQSEEDK
jgi:hypothetical protein